MASILKGGIMGRGLGTKAGFSSVVAGAIPALDNLLPANEARGPAFFGSALALDVTAATLDRLREAMMLGQC